MGSPVTSGMVGIEQLHTGLTVHKVMARAKGLLMSKRELSESATGDHENRATDRDRRRLGDCRSGERLEENRMKATKWKACARIAVIAALSAWNTSIVFAAMPAHKVLLVVAHPDDEYVFAPTTYRIARELGGTVDEVVITNGEGGYRYSLLAEKIYGFQLTREDVGRAHLPAIRKQEAQRAGRILGIRRHYFLNQKDHGYTLHPGEALNGMWDRQLISSFLDHLLERERYDLVFTMLPTEDTHGHHQAATLLALASVARLPEIERPVILGAVPARHDENVPLFQERRGYPLTRTATDSPAFIFDRRASFGFHGSLNYTIVVNWVIAEHKSQGLFQTDSGKHDEERFWLFAVSGAQAMPAATKLSQDLSMHLPVSAHR